MSATVLGDKIYVSTKLRGRLTDKEYRVLLAHEVAHFKHMDRIRIIFLMALIGIVTLALFITGHWIGAIVLMLLFNPIVKAYQRHIELSADRYAMDKTQDFDSFISLMDKLNHIGDTHPTKAERLTQANNIKAKYERY